MATDRRARYNSLPQKLKDVNTALVELNKVITGTTGGGAFAQEMIWGETAEDNITAYMESRVVLTDLDQTVEALLSGLPGSSGVSSAIQTAIDGLQEIIRKVQDTAGELTANGAARLTAFNRLNDPHAVAPSYNYQPPVSEPFGFIPAIEGVINAAADTNADLDDVLGPLKTVAALAESGLAMADFTEFAVATVELLKEALTVS